MGKYIHSSGELPEEETVFDFFLLFDSDSDRGSVSIRIILFIDRYFFITVVV